MKRSLKGAVNVGTRKPKPELPPGLAVEYVPIAQLTPMPGNPRRNEAAIPKVAESIRRFGWTNPILARRSDRVVVAGHTRLEAAKLLGSDKVPVIWVDLDPVSSRLYNLADNRLAQIAEWDEPALAAMIEQLRQEDAEGLSIAGFGDEEIARLLADNAPPSQEDPDEVPEVPGEPWVKSGDLFKLGEHRLLCGDCTDMTSVERLGAPAALGLHDPPYGIGIVEAGLGDGKRHGNAAAPRGVFTPIAGDAGPFDPGHLFASATTLFLWGANHYADRLPPRASWVVWDKRVDLPSNGFSDCELAWVSEGNSARIMRHMWNGMIRASEMGQPRVHPTQKPVALFAEIIEAHTKPGDAVSDWYLGSGTTLLACEQTKRRCRAVELEPKYVQVALERWEKFTGLKAQKL